MLLIGDIHINAKYKDRILTSIKNFIELNPDEKNIVFLWDYIYHFSYDRKAILDLFELFLYFFGKWKNIYVLAGNHDRIGETFVFEEAQKSFEILNNHTQNKIYFITQPQLTEIEWQKILFMPFNFNINLNDLPDRNPDFDMLLNSQKKNEIFSGIINNILYNYVKDNQKIIVFHHYYFANISFPWQFAKFKYNDIAFDDAFLNYDNLYFISGHLHKWFIYKNYFCTWWVWNTSPNEQNDFKFLYKFEPQNLETTLYQNYINPYVALDYTEQEVIDTDNLQIKLRNIFDENILNYKEWNFKINIPKFIQPNLKDITIYLKCQNFDYQNIDKFFNAEIIQNTKEIKIKKYVDNTNNIADMLNISKENINKNISDWKNLLKNYIQNKFENPEIYIKKLQELKII